jgi:hypothetical protein
LTRPPALRNPPRKRAEMQGGSVDEGNARLRVDAPLALVLAAALALRLAWAWSSLARLVRDATSDDAYYYFQIARNLVRSGRASFDGETLTNGFHPLWLLCVAAVHASTADPERAVHLALSLSALFGTATCGLVYAILRATRAPRAAALAAAAAYAIHPYVAVESVNGLETALSVLALALVVWVHVRSHARDGAPTPGDGLRLGAALGLAMLARTDAVLIAPPLLLHLAWSGRGARRWLPPAAAVGLASLLVAPWLLWSWLALGGVVQDSARALSDLVRSGYLAAHGDALAVRAARGLDLAREAFLERVPRYYLVPWAGAAAPACAAAAALLAAMLWLPRPTARERARRRLALLAAPALGIAGTLLFHAGFRWWLREWYFAPMGLLCALGTGLVLAWLDEAFAAPAARPPRARALLYSAAALAALGALGPQWTREWVEPSPHRLNELIAARWLADHTAPDARVGSWNAGLIGYWSGRTVVNLDGVVNGDAWRATREGRLHDYALERRLEYLVDWAGMGLALCRKSDRVDCERIAVLGVPAPAFGDALVHVVRLAPRAGAAPETRGAVPSH